MNRSTCVCVPFLFADMLHVIHNIFSELFDISLKDSQGFPRVFANIYHASFRLRKCVSYLQVC